MDINKTFAELAKYNRILEETETIVESLKDDIKAYMTAQNVQDLRGLEHVATWHTVNGTKTDTAALKRDYPEIIKAYTVPNVTRRFLFK